MVSRPGWEGGAPIYVLGLAGRGWAYFGAWLIGWSIRGWSLGILRPGLGIVGKQVFHHGGTETGSSKDFWRAVRNCPIKRRAMYCQPPGSPNPAKNFRRDDNKILIGFILPAYWPKSCPARHT